MRRWLKKHVQGYMIRPIIYKASSRFAYTLALALIWDRFFSRTPTGLSTCFVLLTLAFALGMWLAHLRLDGYKLPRLPEKKLKSKDKGNLFYGDMIDYVDEPVTTFDDLDREEQEVCLMLADLACAIIYLAASLFV